MGPTESAGKNDRTPTIRTVPTSKTTKVTPETGKVPPLSGTIFFFARFPASARTGTRKKKRPIIIAIDSVVLYQGVLADNPANALPLLAVAEEKAYRISLNPCGPALFRPERPHRLTTAHAVNTMMSKISRSTASALTFTSYDSIFFPRYSGVRPTIKPARKTVRITKTSMP